jgi:hypothetical protein
VPNLGYLDLSNAHTTLANDYNLAGGSKLHTHPNAADPIWLAVPKSSQSYTDLVTSTCTCAGYSVYHLVLSPKVLVVSLLCSLLVLLRWAFMAFLASFGA